MLFDEWLDGLARSAMTPKPYTATGRDAKPKKNAWPKAGTPFLYVPLERGAVGWANDITDATVYCLQDE